MMPEICLQDRSEDTKLSSTPSQTVGPYLHIGLDAGEIITDAVIETWQADAAGRFDHPDDPRGAVAGFRGFGRVPAGRGATLNATRSADGYRFDVRLQGDRETVFFDV